MLFKNITILNEDFEIEKDCFVGVSSNKIDYIGKEKPKGYKEEYDGKNKLLMSGFYNSHSHAAMTLLRGYADDLPLYSWLNERVFPFEAHLDEEAVYNGTMLACAEMLSSGTVSFSDMYMFGEGILRAVKDSKMKANISVPTICFDDSSYFDLPSYKESQSLYDAYHKDFDGRLLIDFCIHAEYTSTKKVVKELAEYAKSINARIQVHISETKKEHEECKERHGKTPTQYFYENGLFDLPLTAAHCIYLEDEDIRIFRECGAFVALNPASNLKLASGFAPINKMLATNINLCLGTDGSASNNNLDIWRDLYLLSLIYKGYYEDAALVKPKQALQISTLNGALSQGRNDCGSLKLGKRADLIVVDMAEPHFNPQTNILSNLCYSASGADVCLTMIDGEVLYKNGDYTSLDIEKTKFNAQKSLEKILKKL